MGTFGTKPCIQSQYDYFNEIDSPFSLHHVVSSLSFYYAGSIVAIWINNFKIERKIQIQSARPTKECGKEYSMGTGLLLSDVTDADHQYCHLFKNKGQFVSPFWIVMRFLGHFHD